MSNINYFDLFKNLIKFLAYSGYEQLKDYYELLKKSRDANDKSPFMCGNIRIISDIIIIGLWLFLISSVLWIIYEIYYNVKTYLQLTSYKYFSSKKPNFRDSPLFKQLENLFYLNDYFSIDSTFFIFILTLIFIIIKLNIFERLLNKDIKFNFLKFFCYIAIILGIIYYLLSYLNITSLGKRVNAVNRLYYTNINTEFINSKKICNYLNKKSEFDNDFVYGKCNDIKNNISISRLYEYIKGVFDDINQNHKPIADISTTQFKSLKDKNGILYKDKIISALFTFNILKYFVDNDLIDEAKDFFSAFNLLYAPNINILKKKINPVLYLKINNIILFENDFAFEGDLKKSFYNEKEKFEYIKMELRKNQNTIQKIVVDIYDICSSKLISIYFYYFALLIIIIILISIYAYYPQFKFPFY